MPSKINNLKKEVEEVEQLSAALLSENASLRSILIGVIQNTDDRRYALLVG